MSGNESPDPLDSPPGDHSPGHVVGWDDTPHFSMGYQVDDNLDQQEVTIEFEGEEQQYEDNSNLEPVVHMNPELTNFEPVVSMNLEIDQSLIRNFPARPFLLTSVTREAYLGSNLASSDSETGVTYEPESSHSNQNTTDSDLSDLHTNIVNRIIRHSNQNARDNYLSDIQRYLNNRRDVLDLHSDNANRVQIPNPSESSSSSNQYFDADSSSSNVPEVRETNEGNVASVTSNLVGVVEQDDAVVADQDDATATIRRGEPLTEEPPAKLIKMSSPKSPASDSEGDNCPICLEHYGNSGEHRLVALRCGHLFGYKCVERWLKARRSRERCCPTCKSKATSKDLRFIFARRLVAADVTEITSLQKEVEILKADKNRLELELQKSKIAHRATIQKLESLQIVKPPLINARKGWRFALEKNLEVCKDGACRVMAYNCRTYELYVSQKSSNSLFPGFGVRKISCVDYNMNQFIHLHPKAIRDIAYSQPKDLLLSVSLDSTARIVERGIPSMSIRNRSPLWSCAWDVLNENNFFTGGVGGVISQYDVRHTTSPLNTFTSPTDLSPCISLCSTEFGLLSCSLNSSFIWVPSTLNWEPKLLPIEGPYMSMSYDMDTQRALVSCRPNANERSRLIVCKLNSDLNGPQCQVEQILSGSSKSTLMSRATWVKVQDSSWLAAHSETDSSLYLHGIDGSRTMSLPASDPALDVCSVNLNGDTLLTALSESRLRIYKAVPTNL